MQLLSLVGSMSLTHIYPMSVTVLSATSVHNPLVLHYFGLHSLSDCFLHAVSGLLAGYSSLEGLHMWDRTRLDPARALLCKSRLPYIFRFKRIFTRTMLS